MKKLYTYTKPFLLLLLTSFMWIASAQRLFAQGCKQVEILHQSPDCLNPRDDHAGTPDQQRDCKSIAVCLNQPYTYSASGTGWVTYNWSVTGPTSVVINPNNTSPNITIIWPAVGTYTLMLTVTDAGGNSFTNCVTVQVKDKPVANFTFSPNNVCAGSTIIFTNTTTFSGSVVYSWNFGDPPSGNLNYANTINASHQYNSPGTYTVTLIASSFSIALVPNTQGGIDSVVRTCCSDTITKRVIIKQGTLKIECISTVCANDTATYHAVGCANPTWLTPVGGTILSQSGTSVTIVWGNGAVQGQIQAVCPGGCTTSVAVPIIPQNPIPVGNLIPCPGSNTSYTLPLLPGTFYTWQLNNITANTNHNAALSTFPDNNTVWINWMGLPPGTYELSVTLENKHICCNSTGKITITPKPRFTAYFNQTVCKGTAANLSVFPTAGNFNWIVVPATGVIPPSGTGSTFNPVFTITGTYTVKVYETTGAYCNSLDTQYIKVKVVNTPAPGTITGPATVCPNGQYNYSMSSSAPSGYFYSWTITSGAGTFQPGNLTTATGDAATILWTTIPGTISVVLQASTPPPCPSPAVTLNVTQAVIGTISGSQNVCVDDAVPYTLTGGNLPAGENVQWSINLPSLGTITLGQGTSSPTILWHGQVSGSGPWNATITATSACGSTSWPVTISKKPVFTLTQTGNICMGGATLSATAGYTYSWSPGGATSASITVTNPGTYTVTVTNGSCSVTRSITVEDPFAIAPLTCGVGTCNGANTNEQLGVRVTKPGSGTFTYQWFSGTYPSGIAQGGPVTTTNTTNNFTATAPGNYYVVVTYGTCTKYVTFTVKKVCCPDVNKPQITSVVRNSCNQFTFTGVTPNPTGATITWDFGDGNTATGTSGVPITHTYASAGIYCVKFCVGPPSPNPTNCTGNCTATSVIVPLQALFNYTLGCNGCININNLSVVIPTSNAATAQYNWNFGDGSPVVTTSSPTPPTHCYTIAGPHTLTLTINYSDPSLPLTCTSTYSQTVTYTPLSITMNTPVCGGQLVNMSSNPGGFVTYAWNFGDTYSSYISPTTHAYSNVVTPTPYTVTLVVTDALGNTCTATQGITVNPGIDSCTIQPGFICPGGTATLSTPLVTGYTYLWEKETSPGVFVPAPLPNTGNTYTTNVPGYYHVVISNTYNCKCTSNTVQVKSVPKPKAIISASPGQLCGGGNVMLSTPYLPNHTYAWYVNTISGAPASTGTMYPVFGQTATTTYFLILINEYNCSDTCQVTIPVYPVPAPPAITASPTLCEGAPITLTVTNYANNITWNTGSNTISTTVYTAGNYTATYTNPSTGCSNSSSITINRRPPIALFPHFCDSIPCNCRKDTLFAPKPLVGIFATNYNIQWYYNGNPVGTNGNNPFYTPTPAGTYFIIVTDPVTGCKDTSDTYTIALPSCDSCDCKGSKWGKIILKQGDNANLDTKANNLPTNLSLKCNGSYVLKCNQPYTINANYICADTSCPSKVTYSLQPPTGSAITGTAPVTFTPTMNGVYTLTLYGWCNGKICDSCIIKFEVKDCEKECDCKGSKWGEMTISDGNSSSKLNCNKTYDRKCNKPFTINASYICPNPNCPGSVNYTMTPPVGLPVFGSVPLTYTPTQSGIYTLVLYGMCGNTVCDSCVVKFKVECVPIDSNCCPYDIKIDTGKVTYTITPTGNATIANQTFTIGGLSGVALTEVRAEVLSYSLSSNFNNECLGCKTFPFTWASTSSATNIGSVPGLITMFGTTTPLFLPTGTMVYQNPREVVWNNGSTFNISTPIGINFLLPPPPIIDCCELLGKICVKFTFRDDKCRECEAIICFNVVIKKK